MPTKKAAQKNRPSSMTGPPSPFITIGIGASAGGLEAMVDLLHNLPESPNAAFVIIHHADPSHPSSLRQILARESRIAIADAVDGTPVEVNTVYIAPGGADVTLHNGTLQVRAAEKRQPRMPIDFFFRSLAEDRGSRAVAVVLSGSPPHRPPRPNPLKT